MTNDTALLIIDMQVGMFEEAEPVYQGTRLLQQLQMLIEKARSSNAPIVYIQHNEDENEPLASNSRGWKIHPDIAPEGGDITIQKWTPDSFHKTNLQAELDKVGVRKLVLAGSVGNPLDEITASYALIEGIPAYEGPAHKAKFRILLNRVPYDVERAIDDAKRVNMPDTEAYVKELRTGRYRGLKD